MNKIVLSLLLLIGGVVVIVMGTRREDSVAGVSDRVGTSVANAFDGKARQPEHVWYYVGGAALIIAGLVVATRKS